MRYDTFHAATLRLVGATYHVKFGDKRTYCVAGRMFARAGALGEAQPLYGFKASELSREMLIAADLARPMPYLHRAGWVQVLAADALPDNELLTYVAEAHRLVAARLTRAERIALGLSAK